MAEIKVTSTELRNKAAELRQQNQQFKSTVEGMVGTEQQLMGQWDGESKEQFHAAFTKDKGQMDEFYNTIELYCKALEASADAYDKAEQKNVQTASTRTYG